MLVLPQSYGATDSGGGTFPDMTGQSFRRLRVNEIATATEWDYDGVNAINVEEARSDIRSTTRAGYSTHNSYPGLQALLDAIGPKKTLLLPSNGIFNLGGNMLQTKSSYQRITSLGRGEITSGGIQLGDGTSLPEYGTISNIFFTGATPLGVDVQGPYCTIENCDFKDKTVAAVRNIKYRAWYMTVLNSRMNFCPGHAIYGHASDGMNLDRGDYWINDVKIMQCGVGMEFRRVGGVNIIGSKVQSCNYGLMFYHSQDMAGLDVNDQYLAVPSQGHYIDNLSLEDNIYYDLKVSVYQAPDMPLPRTINMVGGTAMKILLEAVEGISLIGVAIPGVLTQGVDAIGVMTSGCTAHTPGENGGLPFVRNGAGTSYIDYLIDKVNGPRIRTGTRLRIDSVDGTAYIGGYKTSIIATPAYIGQTAFVAGVGYMATGISSPSDWKQITN